MTERSFAVGSGILTKEEQSIMGSGASILELIRLLVLALARKTMTRSEALVFCGNNAGWDAVAAELMGKDRVKVETIDSAVKQSGMGALEGAVYFASVSEALCGGIVLIDEEKSESVGTTSRRSPKKKPVRKKKGSVAVSDETIAEKEKMIGHLLKVAGEAPRTALKRIVVKHATVPSFMKAVNKAAKRKKVPGLNIPIAVAIWRKYHSE